MEYGSWILKNKLCKKSNSFLLNIQLLNEVSLNVLLLEHIRTVKFYINDCVKYRFLGGASKTVSNKSTKI